MLRLNNEKEEKLVKELREKGEKIYSISRLNTFNTCAYEYHLTYNKRQKGVSNPYSECGSEVHDFIEKSYSNGEYENKVFNQKLHDKLMELEIMGLDFPSDKIKDSFTADLDHFTKNFKLLNGEFTLEKMFVTKIGNTYLLGYIDAIRDVEGKLEVIDWKTSSKFSGKEKLKDAGRQLLIYKIGLEQTLDIKIDELKWCMLKYVYVCYKQANGKIKKQMVNRSQIVNKMKKAFEKDMIKAGLDELEIQMLLFEAESKNDISILPSCITDKYTLEDCFVEYEATEELIEEVESYVEDTVNEIEGKDSLYDGDWSHVDFDKDGTFYCNTLCSHRMECEFIKEYNKSNKFKSKY